MMLARITRLMPAMTNRNPPETLVPTQPAMLCSDEFGSATPGATERRPDAEQEGQHEDDRRMAEREEEAHRQRTLALRHELAGGVVDCGEVVGVERVTQTQRVGGNAEADTEDLVLGAEVVVVRGDDGDQGDPADHVKTDDDARPWPAPATTPAG